VTTSSKLFAFLAYLLLIIGWLFVFLFRRNDKFAMYHTKQSVVLVIAVIIVPLAWAIAGWIISWLPFIGFTLAVAFFALVIAVELCFLIAWIVGMVYAGQGRAKPLPFVGSYVSRIFG
jgi:uncharacterized membrane protein